MPRLTRHFIDNELKLHKPALAEYLVGAEQAIRLEDNNGHCKSTLFIELSGALNKISEEELIIGRSAAQDLLGNIVRGIEPAEIFREKHPQMEYTATREEHTLYYNTYLDAVLEQFNALLPQPAQAEPVMEEEPAAIVPGVGIVLTNSPLKHQMAVEAYVAERLSNPNAGDDECKQILRNELAEIINAIEVGTNEQHDQALQCLYGLIYDMNPSEVFSALGLSVVNNAEGDRLFYETYANAVVTQFNAALLADNHGHEE